MTPFGHAGTSGNMVGSFWLNMDPGGPSGTQVMTILGFYVSPQISNVEKVGSYMLMYIHYTFIYLYIPANSFIYLHIPPHTSKCCILENEGQNKTQKCSYLMPPGIPQRPNLTKMILPCPQRFCHAQMGIKIN